jgi:uncharacterized repeat protein (TIGR01451 family)
VVDNNNWARAVASNQAALTAFKSASPTGPVAPGSTITYTISGANVGGSAAYGYPVTVDGTPRNGILIEDTIPDWPHRYTRFPAPPALVLFASSTTTARPGPR